MKDYINFIKHLLRWEKTLLALTMYNVFFVVFALSIKDGHAIRWFLLSLATILLISLLFVYKREYKHWHRWGY